MLRARMERSGWRAIVLVAITYIDFLIFAQFAFLKRINSLGLAADHLKPIMAAMAIGGILFSLLLPRIRAVDSVPLRLRAGLVVSGAAAFLTLLPLSFAAAVAVAFVIGAGLGILTVTLVTHLREWAGNRNPLLAVGLGTGLGYFACNFPPLFNASAAVQSVCAGVLCLGATLVPLSMGAAEEKPQLVGERTSSRWRALIGFTALVWLDSAAFYIIQSTPQLKAGTWQGTLHLWLNGVLHFSAAVASAWLLRRRGFEFLLNAAFIALGCACLLLIHPERALMASVFYPVGVSLYSVALVAYPSLLYSAASTKQRGVIAGWIYAVAGWGGSAMGIGMGQNLGHVPPMFVAAAGIAILGPQILLALRKRAREFAAVAAVGILAFSIHWISKATERPRQLPQIERGRQIYISEGCIHCHSQYVRPNTADVLLWGPATPVAQVRLEEPPLIGNRRQGPDLAEVGIRRSALWLKAHLCDPREVSGASVMPGYGFLFQDERGNDLVAYLQSLRSSDLAQHAQQQNTWLVSRSDSSKENAADGQRLYARYCATCHEPDGVTRRRWGSEFKTPPTDFDRGEFRTLSSLNSPDQLTTQISRIVKFGIAGTDMPGHEYLPDDQVGSISLWLSRRIAQSHLQRQDFSKNKENEE